MIDIEKEREAFEAWALTTYPPSSVMKSPGGAYTWTVTGLLWDGWMARAQQGAA